MSCPACQGEVPAGARFCPNCASAVAGPAAEAERFRREARTAARLSHPSNVPLLTFSEVKGQIADALAYALAAVLASAAVGCGGGPGAPDAATSPSPGGGTRVTQVANEGWDHVPEGTAIGYRNNPPASGPHYPVWARHEVFTTAVARGYWVHNLEHGAVVFLYRPDVSPAVVAALGDVFRALPIDPQCGHARALVTPDPMLPRPMIAVVAANWVLTADAVDASAVREFVLAHRNHAPENVCEGGTRP